MDTVVRVLPTQRRLVADSWSALTGFVSPFTTGVLCAFVYLLTLTSDYFWDGITFALQIEKVARAERHAQLLFHQNHLLYNAFGYLLYNLARTANPNIRALTVLQVANVFVASAAVAVFFKLAERLTRSRDAALICSGALAFSASWWKLATDADAYVLSVLLILLCLNNLFSLRPRWYIAGLALAGAMLIHELASLFSIAAIVSVLCDRNIKRRVLFCCGLCALAWSLAISAYCVSARLLHGITSPRDLIRWATSNPSLVSPSFKPTSLIMLTARSNFDLFVGHSFSSTFRQLGTLGWVTAFGVVVACVFIFKLVRSGTLTRCVESIRRPSPEIADPWNQSVPVLITWVSVYLVFLCFFEPQDPYLRLFYAPAPALGFGLVFRNYRLLAKRKQSASDYLPFPRMALIGVMALALSNFAFFIKPHMRSDTNPVVAAARNASTVWSKRTVILYGNRNEADTTFEYFNKATKWKKLSGGSPASLDSEIESIFENGGSVWLNKGAIEKIDPSLLDKYVQGRRINVDCGYAPALYVELLPE